MTAHYIMIEDIYVKAIVISSQGFEFIPAFDKEKAGIWEIEKCEAFKKALLEKNKDLKIEFEEFVKEVQ